MPEEKKPRVDTPFTLPPTEPGASARCPYTLNRRAGDAPTEAGFCWLVAPEPSDARPPCRPAPQQARGKRLKGEGARAACGRAAGPLSAAGQAEMLQHNRRCFGL